LEWKLANHLFTYDSRTGRGVKQVGAHEEFSIKPGNVPVNDGQLFDVFEAG
jgi:hypothetical protein